MFSGGDSTPYSDYDATDLDSALIEEATGRLFLTFNTSTTLTTAQAIALILGLTALFGGLAAAASFFLLSMQGGGDTGGGGSSYGNVFSSLI